jgi:hypothetical protein
MFYPRAGALRRHSRIRRLSSQPLLSCAVALLQVLDLDILGNKRSLLARICMNGITSHAVVYRAFPLSARPIIQIRAHKLSPTQGAHRFSARTGSTLGGSLHILAYLLEILQKTKITSEPSEPPSPSAPDAPLIQSNPFVSLGSRPDLSMSFPYDFLLPQAPTRSAENRSDITKSNDTRADATVTLSFCLVPRTARCSGASDPSHLLSFLLAFRLQRNPGSALHVACASS